MNIRDFEDRDVEALVALRNRAAPREPSSAEAFRALPREGQHLRTLEEGGLALGFGLLRPWPWGDGPGALGMNVFVEEDARRRGRGRRLCEDLLEEADRRGWTRLHGGFYESSEGALPFAAAMGFEVWLREDAFTLTLDGDYDAAFAAARARVGLDDLEFTTLDRIEDEDRQRRLHELCLPIFRQVPEFEGGGDPDFESFHRGNLRPPLFREDCIFVVRRRGRLLAYTQHRLPPGGQPFIHMTGTHPDFQRRGLARCVKLFSQREQQRRGFTAIHTGSAEGNVGMQALNRELGFRVNDGYLFVRRDRPGTPAAKE